ncbi:MAG: cation transporter [Rhizobiales bacterium]|nr:cation transporter [Hyphomicrobiales bacterium]
MEHQHDSGAAAHAHGHSHSHAHAAGHSHSHVPADFGTAFAIAAVLNVALIVAQVIVGLAANSIALLADAGHNLGDVLGLLLAWAAHVLARRQPTERYTYGFRSASILAALFNAVTLLIATGAIVWEALRRMSDPGEVAGGAVIAAATAGVVVNGFSAWLLMRGHRDDLNVRGAFLHLLADAGVSVGVVLGGIVILMTGWNLIDPILSLLISVVIVWGTWNLLRESTQLAMNAVPSRIVASEVRESLAQLPGVVSVHDLHIWAMSTTEIALTAHLVMPSGHPGDAFLVETCHMLDHRFGIAHPTLQIELSDAGACALEPAHIV